MTRHWRPDILDGHEAIEFELTGVDPLPEETPESLRATLVRFTESVPGRATAVLYLHGWNDYYFQSELAAEVANQGYGFYALDLRRYGRSLRQGQLRGYIDDLSDYATDIAMAVRVIAEQHSRLVLMGHSTGGLTAALWASRYGGRLHGIELIGLVLNSPWLDLRGSPIAKAMAGVLQPLAQRRPTAVLPLSSSDNYFRSLHANAAGDWDFNIEWKRASSVIRAGWLNAIVRGHQQVRRGLDIPVPVLVGCSDRSDFAKEWSSSQLRADVVLDVHQIADQAKNLGRCVTLVRVVGGIHDLVLSAPEVRATWFAEQRRWLRGYAPAGGSS